MDNFDNQIEEKIDAALGNLGAAMPPLGLEQRVLLRIAKKNASPALQSHVGFLPSGSR